MNDTNNTYSHHSPHISSHSTYVQVVRHICISYLQTNTHEHTRTHTNTKTHAYIHVCTHTSVHRHTHIHTRTRICTHFHQSSDTHSSMHHGRTRVYGCRESFMWRDWLHDYNQIWLESPRDKTRSYLWVTRIRVYSQDSAPVWHVTQHDPRDMTQRSLWWFQNEHVGHVTRMNHATRMKESCDLHESRHIWCIIFSNACVIKGQAKINKAPGAKYKDIQRRSKKLSQKYIGVCACAYTYSCMWIHMYIYMFIRIKI